MRPCRPRPFAFCSARSAPWNLLASRSGGPFRKDRRWNGTLAPSLPQRSGSASKLLHELVHSLPEPLDVLAEGPDRLQDRFLLAGISGPEEIALQLGSRPDRRLEILPQLLDFQMEEAVPGLLFPILLVPLGDESSDSLPERASGNLGKPRKNFLGLRALGEQEADGLLQIHVAEQRNDLFAQDRAQAREGEEVSDEFDFPSRRRTLARPRGAGRLLSRHRLPPRRRARRSEVGLDLARGEFERARHLGQEELPLHALGNGGDDRPQLPERPHRGFV